MNDEVTTSEIETAPAVELGTEQVSTPSFDPETATMDELRTKIEQEFHENAQKPEEPDSEVFPDDFPDEVEAAADPVEDTGDAPTEELATEDAAAEPEPTPEISNELLVARIEEAEARSKHFESTLGQRTGAEGYLQQQIQHLQQQLDAARAPTTDDPYEDRPAERYVPPTAPLAPDTTTQWAVGSAIRQGAEAAIGGRQDLHLEDGKTINPDFVNILTTRKDDMQRINTMTDPVYAGQQMAGLMGSVLSEFDVVLKQRAREEVEKRSAVQGQRLRDKKRASATASSGSRPIAKAKSLDPMTMPVDELRQRINDKQFS